MTQGFFAASVAASQQQYRLNVHANNLANVNTEGFKAKVPVFSDLLYRTLITADQSELRRGTGSRMVQTTTDFTEGAPKESAQFQSYTIFGRGFFMVENPATGDRFYTRSGNFHFGLIPGGAPGGEDTYYLCNPEGYYVLDQNQQPIVMGEEDETYPVGVFDFTNTDDITSVTDSRLTPVDKNGDPLPASGTARRGLLEMSNTDVGHEFAKVIESQRTFTYALKMIQTQDETETTVNDLRS